MKLLEIVEIILVSVSAWGLLVREYPQKTCLVNVSAWDLLVREYPQKTCLASFSQRRMLLEKQVSTKCHCCKITKERKDVYCISDNSINLLNSQVWILKLVAAESPNCL